MEAATLVEEGSTHPPATGLVKYADLPAPKPSSHMHSKLKTWWLRIRGWWLCRSFKLGGALWRMAHFLWATVQHLYRTGSYEAQLFGCQPLVLPTKPSSPCTVEQLPHCHGPSLVTPSVEWLYVPLGLLIRGTISTLSRYDQQTNGEGP